MLIPLAIQIDFGAEKSCAKLPILYAPITAVEKYRAIAVI